jgi:hypothetical protein
LSIAGAQIGIEDQACARAPVHVGGVEAEDLAAVVLCPVHRQVAVAQQLLHVGAVGRVHGDADAGAERDLLAGMRPGLVDRVQNAVGHVDGVFVARDARLQDRKFVAAKAGDRVDVAHDRAQPVGDLDEELVADLVTETVVDVLEAVEIDEVERKRAVAAARAGDLTAQAVGQQRAVRQVCQDVVVRHVEEVVLRPLAIGDVERGGEHADHGVRAVAQRRFRGEEDALGAVAVDDVLFEAGQRGLCADDLAIEGLAARGMILAETGTHIEADRFGRTDAGKRGQDRHS